LSADIESRGDEAPLKELQLPLRGGAVKILLQEVQRERGLLPFHEVGPDKLLPDNVRKQRMLRWTMVFDTKDGADYAKQLDALGAILAVPADDGKFLVIRDLKQRPVKPVEEDIKTIQRIFWVDDRTDSVAPLAKALQLKDTPRFIVAFFPEKLEKELLAKELKFQGKKVHEIEETRFRVVPRGDTCVPLVIDQR
jgi:hypothetical protein